MNYEVGDIILLKPPKQSLFGRIITSLTVSPYSHTAVIYEVGTKGLIYDIGTTTKLRNINVYDNNNIDIYRIKGGLNDKQKDDLQMWCRTHLGVKYDYLQLLSYLDKFLFKLNYVFNLPNRYVCSEAIDRMYKHIGIDLIPAAADGDVTPADISRSPLLVKVN